MAESGADLVNLDFELSQRYTAGVNMPAPSQAGYVAIANAEGNNLTYIPFGSLPTAILADNAVTNAKLANVATGTVKARLTAGTGDPEDVTLSALATALGVGGVSDNAVTNVKLRDSVALSVIGRSANTTGDPADIAAGTDGYVLRRSGTTLGFGQVVAAGIQDNQITNAKIRQAVALSLLGNSGSTTSNVDDIVAGTDGYVMRRSGTALGFGQIVAAGVTDGTLTNAKFANMADGTIKGRAFGAGLGAPVDLTRTQLIELATSCCVGFGSSGSFSTLAALPMTEVIDTEGYHSDVTNNTRFTAPATGTYLVLAQVTTGVNITAFQVRQGGSTVLTNSETGRTVLWAGALTAGQYVEIMLSLFTTGAPSWIGGIIRLS